MTLDSEQRSKIDALRREIKRLEASETEAKRKARAEQRRKRTKAHVHVGDQRRPRERDAGFLSFLRRQECIAGLIKGGCNGPIEAAHLRFSNFKAGRVNPGKSAKSSDRFATPLCRHHHQSDQHLRNERAFWEDLGVEPDEYAAALYAAFKADGDGVAVVQSFAGGRSNG